MIFLDKAKVETLAAKVSREEISFVVILRKALCFVSRELELFVRHADVADLEGKPESVHFSKNSLLLTPTASRLPYPLANRSADASCVQKMQKLSKTLFQGFFLTYSTRNAPKASITDAMQW